MLVPPGEASMRRVGRPHQWAAIAIAGAIMALGASASAQTGGTTAGTAAPTTSSVVDKCRGVAHNRSQEFRDINGQPLTSPSVITVGLLLTGVAPNTGVGVTFSVGGRAAATGSARLGSDGRVLVAVPISSFETYTPSLFQIGSTRLDPSV